MSAERAVCARVLLVADADQRLVEQRHDRGEHLLPRQARRRRSREPARGWGSAPPNGEQAIELRLVARRAPVRVVAVLLATRASRPVAWTWPPGRADPDVGPGRRNRERGDALPLRGVADGLAVRVPVGEPEPGAMAGDPRDGRRSRSGGRPRGRRHEDRARRAYYRRLALGQTVFDAIQAGYIETLPRQRRCVMPPAGVKPGSKRARQSSTSRRA